MNLFHTKYQGRDFCKASDNTNNTKLTSFPRRWKSLFKFEKPILSNSFLSSTMDFRLQENAVFSIDWLLPVFYKG
ncbi:hypothetical protein EGK75_04530 [Neisseria weixii]|uniref:Uncharacterized protein n=1 Tax=Neisseria weixii TaxID=1853276 RepID=A0A3N4N880_9NEIS|nr:hypothetical protein CGZ65_01685 [Neisseria weixii]RPD87549.1 hypothetical protein EGK74_05555 [Neisseria weixii]RPD89447.1 hypothetical protein EGK75_04530 [Neisseria weixii]